MSCCYVNKQSAITANYKIPTLKYPVNSGIYCLDVGTPHHTLSILIYPIPCCCSIIPAATYPLIAQMSSHKHILLVPMCTHISYCYILFILLLKKYHVRIYIKTFCFFVFISPLSLQNQTIDLKLMQHNLRLDSRTRTHFQDIVLFVI